ncbi:MAG: hypothetical protein NTX03_14865 [Bacteroidetes bacterium]|nr:hypothetical protein [Bacteroidota bacterium]
MPTKFITKEEAAKLHLRPTGRKHPVHALIEQMKVGDILLIDKDDFKWKGRSPAIFYKKIVESRKGKFTCLKNIDGGWVVERVE